MCSQAIFALGARRKTRVSSVQLEAFALVGPPCLLFAVVKLATSVPRPLLIQRGSLAHRASTAKVTTSNRSLAIARQVTRAVWEATTTWACCARLGTGALAEQICSMNVRVLLVSFALRAGTNRPPG